MVYPHQLYVFFFFWKIVRHSITLCFFGNTFIAFIPHEYMSNMVYKIAHCSQKLKGTKQINWFHF